MKRDILTITFTKCPFTQSCSPSLLQWCWMCYLEFACSSLFTFTQRKFLMYCIISVNSFILKRLREKSLTLWISQQASSPTLTSIISWFNARHYQCLELCDNTAYRRWTFYCTVLRSLWTPRYQLPVSPCSRLPPLNIDSSILYLHRVFIIL